jgi:CRP-like cAMP-binding protein
MADDEQAARIAREVVLSTFAGEGAKGLTWAFRRITAAMVDLYLEEGAVVFAEGDPATHQYFIVDGEVKLTGSGLREVTFGPRSTVGMLDAVLERPLSWTAVVQRKAHILRIRIEDWLDVLEDSFELSRMIIRNIAAGVHRLRLRSPPLGGFDEPPSLPAASDGPRHLHLVDRVLLLRGVPVFARASIQAVSSLAELAAELRPAAEQVLARSGEPKRHMLVVASGEISATCPAPALRGRFGRGTLVCGALAIGDATDYEVRAEVPSHVLAIARDDYFDIMEEHFGLFRSTLRALVEERDLLVRRG